jgi:hypothetical protein
VQLVNPFRIVVCLGLGFLTTALVAWAFTLISPTLVHRTGGAMKTLTTGRDGYLGVTRLESWSGFGFAAMPITTATFASGGRPSENPPEMRAMVSAWAFDAVIVAFDDPESAAANCRGWWCVEARGFPFAALWCAFESPIGGGRGVAHGGILAPDTLRRAGVPAVSSVVALPLRPIWTGLLVNSSIYATLWWAVTMTPSWRRTFRLRRHHCPACNYDQSGLPSGSACPECGGGAVEDASATSA